MGSIGSEGATGMGSMLEEDQMMDRLSDDVSDTGWDTDLEIEGKLCACRYAGVL